MFRWSIASLIFVTALALIGLVINQFWPEARFCLSDDIYVYRDADALPHRYVEPFACSAVVQFFRSFWLYGFIVTSPILFGSFLEILTLLPIYFFPFLLFGLVAASISQHLRKRRSDVAHGSDDSSFPL
ncbi:MAG: hypothetical protein CMP81_23640 [Fulvimarina sp.]|nr:hypothetical protein [Fulvimarina sp.]